MHKPNLQMDCMPHLALPCKLMLAHAHTIKICQLEALVVIMPIMPSGACLRSDGLSLGLRMLLLPKSPTTCLNSQGSLAKI